MSRKSRVEDDWPDSVKATFAEHSEATMLVETAADGTETTYTTSDYERPADGVDQMYRVHEGPGS